MKENILKIKNIMLILFFITLFYCINESNANSIATLNCEKVVKKNEDFSLSLNLPENAYAAEADVLVKFSDGTTDSAKLVYIKSMSDFKNLVTLNAKITGNATITFSNIIICDENSNEIETNGNLEQEILIIDYENTTIKEIALKSTVDLIKKQNDFTEMTNNCTLEVYGIDGNIKSENEYIGSKNTIIIKNENGNLVSMYTAIIPGDVNGDGKIKMYDAFSILRNVLFNTETMSQIDILISDFDNDGKVKMQDAFSYLKQALFE